MYTYNMCKYIYIYTYIYTYMICRYVQIYGGCMLAVSEINAEVYEALCMQSELSHMASTQCGFYSWLRISQKGKVTVIPPKQLELLSFSWQKRPLFPIASTSQCAGQPSGGCGGARQSLAAFSGVSESQMSQTSRWLRGLLPSLQSASVCFLLPLASSSFHGAFPGMLPCLAWPSLDVGWIPSLRYWHLLPDWSQMWSTPSRLDSKAASLCSAVRKKTERMASGAESSEARDRSFYHHDYEILSINKYILNDWMYT